MRAAYAVSWLLLVALLACGMDAIRVQTRVANDVALAANAAEPLIIRAYLDEGHAEIARVAAAGGTREQAEAALAVVRQHWAPLWGTEPDGTPCGSRGALAPRACVNGAWPALVVVDDQWASTLERHYNGESLSLSDAIAAAIAARTSYCTARALIPPSAHINLPDVPALTCALDIDAGTDASADAGADR